ncbi:histidine phosphatase family protein [Marinicella meishanensis]|uniref:histidine phosphatase family protein n=1 Tax=Marinicella meishanensis TaxID=2873263 RepID=UPI001CBF8DE1|nr:histidine phosphatase family protein [Marinicella sp. NBU2979]
MKTLVILLFCWASVAQSQTWYLVRHAEKVEDSSPDPVLTEPGRQRAEQLANMLSAADIEKIYSTDYQRTQLTAAPLAQHLGLPVISYDPRKLAELAALLKADGVNALVVGHSNTTPMLLHLLSGQATERLDEVDYDNVYQVVADDRQYTVNRLKSWPSQVTALTTPIQLVAERLFDGELRFNMLLNDQVVGESVHQFKRQGEQLDLREITTIEAYNINADIQARVAVHDLSPISMQMTGNMGGPVDILWQWQGQQVTGRSDMAREPYQPQGKLSLNQALPTGTVERTSAIMLAHALPVTAEASLLINWFNGYDGEQKRIHISHEGKERVTVPAGTFDTHKIKYSGGAPSQYYWIDQKDHKVVKIEVIKSPWSYQLVSFEQL